MAGKFDKWHGIDRKEIPWFPTINYDKCIGCNLCFVSCGRMVYEYDEDKKKPVVANPYNCLVGCSTCGTICPVDAIDFPDPSIIKKIEKEKKVLKIIRKKVQPKMTQIELAKARALAETLISKNKTSIDFEATGHFIEKEVMIKILEKLKDKPCDIVNMNINTPSVKACMNEKAPSVMKFTLVSTIYEDVSECKEIVKEILIDTGCVITSES